MNLGFETPQGTWAADHQPEIEAFLNWGRVTEACKETRLYAPPSIEAWTTTAQAGRDGKSTAELSDVILSCYAPDGVGFDDLVQELHSAPLLHARHREVDEVLQSLEDGRHYVTICGALPLVEGLLAEASGKWQNHPNKYPLSERVDNDHSFTPQQENDLILMGRTALDMVTTAIDEVWKSGKRQRVGATRADLNRHTALHGTARGWDTQEHAVRAALLIAAAARVAEPLLAPAPSSAAAGTSS